MGILTFHDSFRSAISNIQGDGFTDAVLLVEGVEIPVHRCILAGHSQYFSHLFSRKNGSQNTSGSQALEELDGVSPSNHQVLVEISDVSPLPADNVYELRNTKVEVVRAVMDYFYRGEYNFDDNVETHWLALKLAHQFKLKVLEETLINELVKSITVENFVDFYNMKMIYENDQLGTSCVSFLEENGEEIANSDNFSKLTLNSLLSLLDEESFATEELKIFLAAERWAGVNIPNPKEVKDIVEKIRLAIIPPKDLFTVVKCSKELPSIDILDAIESITMKDAASTNYRQKQTPPVSQPPVASLNVNLTSMGTPIFAPTGRTSHKKEHTPNHFSGSSNKSHSPFVHEVPELVSMGQTQSNYDITGLIEVFQQANHLSQKELMKAVKDITSTTIDIIPDQVSDILVLLMAGMMIAILVMLYSMNNTLKRHEQQKNHENMILQDRISKQVLTSFQNQRPFIKGTPIHEEL